MLDSYPQVRPGPPRPSTILTPQSLRWQAGEERYEIPGLGSWLLPVATGDRVTVTNAEGGQVAELLARIDHAQGHYRMTTGVQTPTRSQISG